MQIESVTQCQYSNAEKTRIDCMVKFEELPEPVPFTADKNDIEAHGREIFTRADKSEFGAVADHIEKPPFVMPKSQMELRIEKLEAALAAAKIPIP